MKYDYDLFVIGAGSAAARRAHRITGGRQGGHRRGISDRRHLRDPRLRAQEAAGVRRGLPADCWPTRPVMAGPCRPASTGPRLRDRVQAEVTRLSGIYTSEPREGRGHGLRGTRRAAWMRTRVKLKKSGSEITAERILIATGGRPYLPEGLPGAGTRHHFQRGLPAAESCRAASLIVGGGYIALEFANIFNGLGSEDAHRASRRPAAARLRPRPARPHAHRGGAQRRAAHHEGHARRRLEKTGDAIRATLSTGETVDTDLVLYAIGRHPQYRGPGPRARGREAGFAQGAVIVDEYSQTCVENIYAIGDVTQPLESHARRHSRRPRVRRHDLQQAPDARGSRYRRRAPCSHNRRSAPSVCPRPTRATATSPSTSTAPTSAPCATVFAGNETRTLDEAGGGCRDRQSAGRAHRR